MIIVTIIIQSLYKNNNYIIHCVSYCLSYGQGHTIENYAILKCLGKKLISLKIG